MRRAYAPRPRDVPAAEVAPGAKEVALAEQRFVAALSRLEASRGKIEDINREEESRAAEIAAERARREEGLSAAKHCLDSGWRQVITEAKTELDRLFREEREKISAEKEADSLATVMLAEQHRAQLEAMRQQGAAETQRMRDMILNEAREEASAARAQTEDECRRAVETRRLELLCAKNQLEASAAEREKSLVQRIRVVTARTKHFQREGRRSQRTADTKSGLIAEATSSQDLPRCLRFPHIAMETLQSHNRKLETEIRLRLGGAQAPST